jgi:hypothetical protein
MSEIILREPFELTDAELDQITGGDALLAGGLVNVQLSHVSVLNQDFNNITIKDIANNLHLNVGAVIQLLGGVAGIRQLA